MIKLVLIILISIQLLAQKSINSVYYVDSNDINLSVIIKDASPDITLFKIQQNKYKKKIKSKQLINILNAYGYKDIKSNHAYTNFVKKSPIDTTKIESKLKEYYKQNYKYIEIRSITLEPRSYIEELPNEYTVEIRNRNFLKSDGVLNIRTPSRKKIFFNYRVDATVDIYKTRQKIRKNTELSALNSTKKSIILNKFRAKPIQEINIYGMQSRRHIPKGKILTSRDVEELSIVRKGSFVNIILKNNNINISFSAKALQDGKLNQVIRVIKPDGKKLKVKVIGKNLAELR